ncbi:MAG: hypothetical protein PVF74_15215, partial [Anaerolineales bacterium]
WREVILGVVPFFLGMMIMSVPQLVVEAGWASWESGILSYSQNIFGVIILLLSFGVLIYAWRTDWPRWTGTWHFLFIILVVFPFIFLSTQFEDESRVADVFSEFAAVFVLPLLIAWVLYLVVRHDPVRTLLVVIPIVMLIWQPNMEFVPDQIEAPITIVSLFLAALTTIALLRWVVWRAGLWLVILLNAVVGLQFAYAGIYHGGSLPFIASGPSPLEVLKNFIPQFLAVSAIILGPFLAASFRAIGRKSGAAGKLGYHLVLLGMLLVFAGTLANFFMIWDNRLSIYRQTLDSWFTVVFILGLFCYISGVIFLRQAALNYFILPHWLDYFLLLILTLFLPLVLMMPVLDIFTHHSDPLLIFGVLSKGSVFMLNTIGLIWFLLSIWLITHRRRRNSDVGQVVENLTHIQA